MKRKYANVFRKALAFLLVLVMTASYLPVITGAAELSVSNKVADPHTLHNWQAYYGNNSVLPDGSTGISTWKAGGVWTDKSVFATDADITAAGLPTGLADPNAFLVALSALASNKQIVGQSSVPIDTILVLDLSQSMDNSGSVDEMVDAANDTLHSLLEMNVNNRVGVVLYSGNTNTREAARKSSATVILPLDYYTTTSTSGGEPQYLSISGTSDTTVSVASGTRNSNNQRPTGSKNTNGGTYIQNGLYQAYEAFSDVADKGVVQSGAQAGTQRQPVLILMSDGAPTIATSSYYNVGTSNEGDGGSTTNRITFLTQLTAAWVKGKISAHYNNTSAKFYTLGLGTANSADATAVLSPSGSNETLTTYWNNYNKGSSDGDSVTITGNGQRAWNLSYQVVTESVGKNYVDRYWAASNAGDMIDAFKQIVEEIGLQSAYTATLVESGEADLDGYITVEDELGSMMQVKDIKGILLAGRLYTGEELAKSMTEGNLGSTTNPTAYGDEFVATVKERLHIDTSAAQQLIAAAYADNQLYYNAQTGAYANYIGWYGDADNAYLGFWDKESGFDGAGAPAGAKYINQSYGFLGGVAGAAGASDMMHIIVMVHTEITTGHQTVLFKIPAALIPMVEYKVELDGKSLEDAEELTLSVDENDPIRLLYEVGLPDDVTAFNVERKVAEYLSKDGSNHIHKNSDGSYTFYANSWGAHEGKAPDISELSDAEKQALTASVAESHFIPNTANERFYVLEDSVVYDSGRNVLTGLPAAGGEYYFARTIVNVTGAGGAAEAVTQYERLSAATVANSDNFAIVDGKCVVKAGTVRQTLSELELAKTENRTDTIGYSDSLWVYVPGSNADDFNVYSFLGNNGKLTVMPTTGIKVTKDLAEVADGAAADEKFPISVTIDAEVAAPVVTDASGNALENYTLSVAEGKTVITVQLADDESVYISELPAGVHFAVTEADHSKYDYTYTGASQTVGATFVEGVVTNVPVRPGSLYITKEVVHAHAGETFPTDYEFEFRVTFKDAEGQSIANTTFQLENNYDPELTSLTTDENGVMVGKLRHGETTHILQIPAGTVVTVEEINVPDNYTAAYRSRNASGLDADSDGVVTIVSQANATVVVTNTYTPKPVAVTLDIPVDKTFIAESIPTDPITFAFAVQQWNGSAWETLQDKTGTVEFRADNTVVGENQAEVTIRDVLDGITYTHAGTYAYQVLERIPAEEEKVPGLVYDRTLWTFNVTVTDVDGQLVAAVSDVNGEPIADGSYEVLFVNQSHAATVDINIKKYVDDKSENPMTSKAGFAFMAQTAVVDADGNWSVKEDGRTFSVYSDAAGAARMTDVYKAPGEYYYIISEKIEQKPGWRYDGTQYWIHVTVTEDEAGDLSASMSVIAVDSQGNRSEYQTSGTGATLPFTNVYDPGDAEVALNVIPTVFKDLKGRDMVAGEFTFAIFPDGKSSHTSTEGAIAVGTNDAEGNVNFTPGNLTFETVGKYAYDVVEIYGDLGGVVYNPTIFDLVIEVTDNGDGTLAGVYYFEDSITQQVIFENTYTASPAEAVIEGVKTVQVNSGLYTLKAGDFTFGLYQDGQLIARTQNLANGTFAFDKLVYDTVGTHTYEVREIAPDGSTDGSYSANGLRYSGQSFTVTVDVTDNGQGKLVARISANGEQRMEFVNTYASTPAYVSLRGSKTLAGQNLTEGQFRFAIYRSNAEFTKHELVTDEITNDADGNLTFSLGSLGMGYHYFILKEVIPEERAAGIHYDAGEYHVAVQVADSGTGKMNAQTTIHRAGAPNELNPSIVFKNTYRPEDGSVIIDGSKRYTGKNLQANDFSFALYAGDILVDTAQVAADGTFAFETITYTADQIGTHTYTVREVIPEGAVQNADGSWTLGNITYDATVYTVHVSVQDVEGTLQAVKTVEGSNAVIFSNTFTPDPISLELEATKSYNKPLKGGDFTFTLEGEGFDKQEKTNDADGKIVFDPLTLSEAKTYTFTVKEKEEHLWGFISWDKSEYTVEVVVENQNGQLVITSQSVKVNEEAKDGGIVFTNEYVLDGEDSVVLNVHKTMTGDRTDPAGFLFGLYDTAGQLLHSVTSDADGAVSFPALTYDETHVAGSPYTYTVREILPTDESDRPVAQLNGVTYDQTVYTVVVSVADNGQGDVEATYTVDGKSVDQDAYGLTFRNSYSVDGSAELNLAGTKLYTNNLTGELKDLPAGTFQFNLSGEGVDETVSNADGGAFTFSTITYGTADIGKTYVYTVTEVKGDLPYVSYDADVFTVTVKVTDNGQGGIAVEKTITCGETTTAAIAFDNYYNVVKPGAVDIGGSKTYTDSNTGAQKILEEGMFSFRLTGEGQDQTVVNAADGTFAFETIHYTSADIGKTYVYTVSEVKGDKSYITYDTDTFQVTVRIEDDGQGGLKITKTLTGGNEIAFQNIYNTVSGGKVQVQGLKTYTDARTNTAKEMTAGMFFFRLTGNGQDQTVANAADGTFAFAELSYTAADIGNEYTYTISEVKGDKAYIAYDETQYTLTIRVEDDGQGGLKLTKKLNGQDADTVSVSFANEYQIVTGASVSIDGLKTYEGRTLKGDDFTFVLSQDGQVLQSVRNAADGTFAFAPIEYTKDHVGVHTYTVSELHPEGVEKNGDGLFVKDGIVYDANVYTVEVTVADDGQGGLNVTKKVNNTDVQSVSVTFDNAYQLFGNGKLELTGSKTLTGGKPMEDGEFTFGLYLDDQLVAQAQNVGGSFVITKLYSADELGEYTYTLREVIPEGAVQNADGTWTLGTVTYDPAIYTVNVKVYDDQVGGIAVDYALVEAEEIAFENVYTPEPVVITIGVEKILDNRTDKEMSLEGFQFLIALGEQTHTAASDAEGKTGFTVTFHESDIGKTYVFQVSEKNTGIKGMTYDKTVHTVTVQVLQNADGTLSTLINDQAADTVTVQFTNTYEKLVTPPTGDNFNLVLPIALMLASLLGVAAVVIFRKKKAA